jgi:hypothetical protein
MCCRLCKQHFKDACIAFYSQMMISFRNIKLLVITTFLSPTALAWTAVLKMKGLNPIHRKTNKMFNLIFF